jgi:hypothetical protein
MIRAVNALIVKASADHAGYVMTCVQGQRLSRLGLMLLLLGSFTLICRPLLLLILPGIPVLYPPWWRQRFLSDLLVFVVGASIAFWIVTFWFYPMAESLGVPGLMGCSPWRWSRWGWGHMCPIKQCSPLGTGLLGLDAKVGA